MTRETLGKTRRTVTNAFLLYGGAQSYGTELNLGEAAGPLSPRSHCYNYIGPDRTPRSEIILMMNNGALVGFRFPAGDESGIAATKRFYRG